MPSSSLQALLTRVAEALERGRGTDAAQLLAPALRSSTLTRDDELAVRCMAAEAALMHDDLDGAVSALGRPPDTFRETVRPGLLSTLWRLHGRVAFARADQSRAIALHQRALKHGEIAHDLRAIGLAHYELALCYRQVGDIAIVREHIGKAASALHAAADRRHLALVQSLSSIPLAQVGSYDEALGALRQAERFAASVQADDVLATICGNQAGVLMLQHRYEQALALAERSVAIHETHGSGHGLSVALATLGQIRVRLGRLGEAEEALNRALDVRSSFQFHETTGAVLDTLAQIHLIRGRYDAASECLGRASEAYGAYGRQTSRWYEWSVRVLGARLALRRGLFDEALARAQEIIEAGAPPFDSLQATLIAVEAFVAAGRLPEAERRLATVADAIDPKIAPASWGEYLRLRGAIHARTGSGADAYHDFSQSAALLDLLGERYQSALSHLALGRFVAETGARSVAERHLNSALAIFEQLGAERDVEDTRAARQLLTNVGTGIDVISSAEADDAIVRRLVDASALPDLLVRETASALLDSAAADRSVIFIQPPSGDVRVIAAVGCTPEAAAAMARSATAGSSYGQRGVVHIEPLGRDRDGPRFGLIASPRPIGHPVMRQLRTIAAVARQGFALCAARDRTVPSPGLDAVQSLEPLLPGFLSASPAMTQLVKQIERLQGNDLTVLITGESGTGKELIARAIHVGSHRSSAVFLPYNCTTTGRDLADSQLFGHRRGSFTGAVSDQPGLVRAAASGTLFLDEIGDLPLDVQPKLLRFLEQQEILPIGETKPQKVDVRVLAATNADLEQRVSEGRFREDLYYRLSVIRIHVPPLRQRQEEIPHLSAYFLREASERLAKPDVQLSSDTLDLFAQYWWPGNVRQLKNEIQRAVAMAAPGETIEPNHISREITAIRQPTVTAPAPIRRAAPTAANLASAIEQVERDMIQTALDRAGGNISETARALGLTRRGLYLKLRRLGLDVRAELDTH